MNAFEEALRDTLGIEKGYSNHPSDSGGETRYGITKAKARQHGYTGPMPELPIEKAIDIYRADFWDGQNLPTVALLSPRIAKEIFDTGVLHGQGVAGEFLQAALNAFNRIGKDYDDVEVDGDIGPATLSALEAFLGKRGREGEGVLLNALNCLQGAFLIELSQSRPKDEDFVYGWILKRIRIT